MSELSNIIVAMDAIAAALNTANRLTAAVSQATAEGRDITDDELREAGAKTDDLVGRVNREL